MTMILTDGTHLASTETVEELHAFAARIGLRRAWFQDHRIPHYDLTTSSMVQKAVAAGAASVTRRHLLLNAPDRDGWDGAARRIQRTYVRASR